MESCELADKRRLFELFTAIENHIDEPGGDRFMAVTIAISVGNAVMAHSARRANTPSCSTHDALQQGQLTVL